MSGREPDIDGGVTTVAQKWEAARRFYLNKRYEDALEAAAAAAGSGAPTVLVLTIQAMALAQLGRAREALAVAEKAVLEDAGDPMALTARALCHHRLRNEEAALEDYDRALALAPQDFRVAYNIACYWAERADEAKCRGYLTRALAAMPARFLPTVRDDPDLARFHNREWFWALLASAQHG